VLSLQQQTQDQLATLHTAAEEALQQAAQVLLQELQSTAAPAELAAAAAQPGLPLCSDIDTELSLAALQQHANQRLRPIQPQLAQRTPPDRFRSSQDADCDCPVQLQQQSAAGLGLQQGADAQGSDVPWSTANSSWWNARDATGGSAQHCSFDDITQNHAAAGQHKATGNRNSSLDDTHAASLQDQEIVFGHAAAAERRPVLCPQGPDHAGPQTQLQQPQQQHGGQQWQECSLQSCVEPNRTQQLRSCNAHNSEEGRSQSPPAPASLQEAATTSTTRGVHHLQLQARRSSCQLLPTTQLTQALQMTLPRLGSSGGTGCAARRCNSSSSSEAGDGSSMFVTPVATPYHTMPWQPAGGQQSVDKQQQQEEVQERERRQEHAASCRQLRALVSLPARQQGSSCSMQRSLRKCMSSLQVREARAPTAAKADHPAVLRCASGRRQQLEASWQQGLAKAAGQAASSSLHAGAAAADSLSTMRRMTTPRAGGACSGSGSDGSDAAGGQRRLQHAKSARDAAHAAARASLCPDWRSLARQVSMQQHVSVLKAAAPARLRVALDLLD
jgi:hypothetical protein